MRRVLLALLLALPASAASLVVAGDDDMAAANAAAVAGDTVTISPGVYTTAPFPASSGTAPSPIRYLCTGTVVIRVPVTISTDFCMYYGVRFDAGLTVTGASDSLVDVIVTAPYSLGTAATSGIVAAARMGRSARGRARRR